MVTNLSPEKPPMTSSNLPKSFMDLQASPDLVESSRIPDWFKKTVKTVTDAWFDPKSFEQHPGFYERFGIRKFKRFVPTSGDLVNKLVWKKFGEDDSVKLNLASLKDAEKFTRYAETIHMVYFGVMNAMAGQYFAQGELSMASVTAVLNVLGNVYPVMLQRYNRIRLYRAMSNLEERNTQLESKVTE